MIKILLIILLAELWGTAGQILYKKSATSVETPNLRDIRSYLAFIKKISLMPTIWLGLVAVGIGLGIWLLALAQADLSLVFPIDSMQYILALIASRFFLNERIDRLKLVGTLLVMAGIFFVAMS